MNVQGIIRASANALRSTRTRELVKSTAFRSAFVRYQSTATEKPTIVSAALLTRLPIVLPDPEEWEVAYEEMVEKLNQRRCKQIPMDFFTYTEEEKEMLKDDTPPEDMIVGDGFKLAPRETEDDANNNRRSLNRALKTRVFLVVKKNGKWQFPQRVRGEEEIMKDSALASVRELVGENMEFYSVGNAPAAHMDVPEENKKVFFYHSQYYKGDVELNESEVEDYNWATRDELKEYFEPQEYELVKDMLPAFPRG